MMMEMTRRLACAGLFSTLLLAGCATPGVMKPATLQASAAPDANRARVVFMRVSHVAGAIGAELFEVNNDELKFIGQLPFGNKIVYETSPGDKVFMTNGNAADFMTAKLLGGRTYYVILRPNWGTGGFAPMPIRNDGTTDSNTGSREFRAWLADTKPIEPGDKAGEFFMSNKGLYNSLYTSYWARYQRKAPHEKAERHLRPDDGVAKAF